ncbi:MAG: zinc ABC transporter substrate-binding protein [Planctomycetes bacterium]|nr:zinc ABC transporter substrate-binding protein [Planctomycetota bacterium]
MRILPALLFLAALAVPARAQDTSAAPGPLVVCATTPNLGALLRAVAADDVEVTVFCKPTQDPHFLRALPSFVKALSKADLLVFEGLELETGWLPALIDAARNPELRTGARGSFDASSAIEPIRSAATDRSAGDVHALGNPHYLVDPLGGIAVAHALAAKLGELRPRRREAYAAAAVALQERIGAVLFGDELAARFDERKLGALQSHGRLDAFLEQQGLRDRLGGVLGRTGKHRRARVVVDHDAWPYLLRTLQLETAGFLEPYPGTAPSTRHLGRLVDALHAQPARVLLHVPYFEPGPIAFVTGATGIAAIALAHQVGALPGTDDYEAFVRTNLDAIADGLDRSSPAR